MANKNRRCVDASCDRHLELHAARDVPGNNVPPAGMKPAFASLKAANLEAILFYRLQATSSYRVTL